MKEKISLYTKINKIQTALYKIDKNGKNNFAKYDYKRFTDIKNAFNNLLMETKIVFLPTNQNIKVEEMNLHITELNKGARVDYINEYALIDSETAEQHTFYFPMIGTNNDGADKANGSATTYGLKYLFNLWGLIPDESLDPDLTINDTTPTKNNKSKDTTKYNETPSGASRENTLSAIRKLSMENEKFRNYVASLGITKKDDFNKYKDQELIEILKGKL